MISRLLDQLTIWSADYLISWLLDQLTIWSADYSISWLLDKLTIWSADYHLTFWSFGCLISWLLDQLTFRSADFIWLFPCWWIAGNQMADAWSYKKVILTMWYEYIWCLRNICWHYFRIIMRTIQLSLDERREELKKYREENSRYL